MDPTHPQPAFEAPTRRKSVFMEVGLVDEEQVRNERSPAPSIVKHLRSKHSRPARRVRFRSKNDVFEDMDNDASFDDEWETDSESDDDDTFPQIPNRQNMVSQKVYRLGMLAVLLALMLPVLQISSISPIGVRGGVIPQTSIEPTLSRLDSRQDSDPSENVCKRWAGQCRFSSVLAQVDQANLFSRRCQRNTLHVWFPNQQRLATEEQYLE